MTRTLLAILLAGAGILVVACGPSAPPPTPAPTAVPKLQMGQAATVDNLKIVIDSPRRFPAPNAAEEFITFHVAAENTGTDTRILKSNDFYLVDGKGQRKNYEWDPPKESGPGLKQSYLEAKDKAEGNISFLVPKGDTEAVLTYQQLVAAQVYNPQLASWGLK